MEGLKRSELYEINAKIAVLSTYRDIMSLLDMIFESSINYNTFETIGVSTYLKRLTINLLEPLIFKVRVNLITWLLNVDPQFNYVRREFIKGSFGTILITDNFSRDDFIIRKWVTEILRELSDIVIYIINIQKNYERIAKTCENLFISSIGDLELAYKARLIYTEIPPKAQLLENAFRSLVYVMLAHNLLSFITKKEAIPKRILLPKERITRRRHLRFFIRRLIGFFQNLWKKNNDK